MTATTPSAPPLAFRLDEARGGTELAWDRQRNGPSSSEGSWIHLSTLQESHRRWVEEELQEAPDLCKALLAGETRPRCVAVDQGLLMILRGVNLNPGAEVEDMVSLRIFLDHSRMISSSRRRVFAVEALRDACEHERGPRSPSEAFVDLASGLLHRIDPVLEDLESMVDDLEDRVFSSSSPNLATQIAAARRKVIAMRRYLAPQREAWTTLLRLRESPIDEEFEPVLRELGDLSSRYVEELGELKERTAVLNDQAVAIQNDVLNQRMLTLSVITAVFLPLGLLTGLLGINVGGIPGADGAKAFWWVAGGLAVIVIGQLWWLRRRGWL